ncbi:hypothetical protein K432DRAFT_376897 [Lepidopterella palustris CBS 459.81]|uniref:TOM core complex subunit Tom6 n=1 Tax=Lepidopterella palustris CBS 459.81 TaxID=1314670 RepID=A0A8E2ELM0_9PEZI|nr:hypothetical protein K432DRAFT_376897 [Lepidopterella palustris CBS 459.81]
MPPKQQLARSGRQKPSEPNYVSAVISGIISQENRAVVTAVGMFVAGVAFLHSSWSEILLPA